ncbi:MAG: penicillin acylase family protein [Cyclobacteriaceae bacterium]|nr:penicillin acylase family protein [Cyclobacteriaceae bacterium]
MKIFKRIVLGLLLLVLLAVAGIAIYLPTTKPTYQGTLAVEGLKAEVTVRYDAYGVPHIEAQNEEDAYLALGYVHAQDRLFQMEMLRRAASGRLSEVLGPATLKVDKLFRTLGINEFARQHAQKFLSASSDPYQRAALAYQRGINEYIRTGKTPIEFTIIGIPKTPFTPEDMYHAIGFMSFGFAEGLRTDPVLEKIRQELGPDYLRDMNALSVADAEMIKSHSGLPKPHTDSLIAFVHEALTQLPVALWSGSNGWAISGDRTLSGKPILANDTHIGFAQPAVWYEAYLEYPGYKFYGHHLAGIPFGLLGQNEFCAWGLTMFENDDTDFYYETPEAIRTARTREEVIRIKGHEDTVMQVLHTPRGPLVNRVIDLTGQRPVSLWWSLMHNDNESLQAAYFLNHAQNFQQVEKAASLFSAPGLNLMYADRDGNIAWWAVAKLPKRPVGQNPKLFLDAATDTQPADYFSFSENPHAVNPPWGFVYSANNQPDTINGQLYPGYYFPKSRAGRIVELLSEDKKWTVEEVKKTMLDVVSNEHRAIAHEMARTLTTSTFDDAHTVASILKQWNGDHRQAQMEPSVYYHMLTHALKFALEDELGREAYAVFRTTSEIKNVLKPFFQNDSSKWWDNVHTRDIETRKDILEKAAHRTVERLKQTSGPQPVDWSWKKIHTLTHAHPLAAVKPLDRFFNVGPFAVDGGSEVINNLQFALDTTGYYPVTGGPALRKIVDWADPARGVTVSPTGQSGNVMSAFYDDQAVLFAEGKFRTMYWNKADFAQSAAGVLVLQPTANRP